MLVSNFPAMTPSGKKKYIYDKWSFEIEKCEKKSLEKYLSTRTPYCRKRYINYKDKLRKLTRYLRYNYEHNLASNVNQNSKLFWKYAKSSLKTQQGILPLKRSDGTKAILPEEKANMLNEFFTSVFTIEDKENIPMPPGIPQQNTISSIYCTPETVKSKLLKLDANKSPGHDLWHPYFLKELTDVICEPLSILFNKSQQEGGSQDMEESNNHSNS